MHKIIPLLIASVVSPLGGSFGEIIIEDPIGGSLGQISTIDTRLRPSFSQGFSDIPIFDSGISFPRSTPSSSSSYPEIPIIDDYFYCTKYGPFDLDNPTNPSVSFTYRIYSIDSQTIMERVRMFRNGTLVTALTNSPKDYVTGSKQMASFTLPIRDYWTRSGLEMRFEIVSTSYIILKTFSTSIYPPRNSSVPTYDLKHLLYKSNGIGFYGDGRNMLSFRETFDFRGIGDYIDNDYYYRLDISKNCFLYPNDFSLTYKSVSLRFDDSNGLFPYITHQPNGDIVLPLTLYKTNENEIHFMYKDRFYINKRTLQMSSTYRNGYTLTSDFYLPINGLKKFNGTTIYIEFEQLGLDKIYASIPLRYELNRTIVGSCEDGEYCVGGGVGQ